MANHYYGVDMGAGINRGNVSTGTATTSKGVELVVLDGVTGNNKKQVLLAIEAIRAAIATGDAPA